MMWTPVAVHFFVLVKLVSSQSSVEVMTSKGTIIGKRLDPNPATNASYDKFLGIPYGQIPGRFQLPVPRSNWSSPLTTQSDGPVCPQPNVTFSEDCLYMNVFTPVDAFLTPRKFPVMAFIHGSAFTFTSSNSNVYGPDFLVPQGIILVTFNYRLGAAGFLTLASPLAPGNLGIYDTMLALQWIQEEISAFGGDPDQVTLAGQSAGSAITMFHYLSPVSSGFFKQAIAQSGSAFATWTHTSAEEGVRRAKLLSEAVGCDSKLNDSLLLKCLQNVDIDLIVENQNIPLPLENMVAGTNLPFVPVMDSSFGQPSFFNDSLENLAKQALARSKPLISGFTTEEGIFLFMYDNWKLVESNLNGFVPWSIKTTLNEHQKAGLAKTIRNRYFPNKVDDNKILDIVRLYTDYLMAYPTIETNHQFSNWTYSYVFAYDGPWTPMPDYFTQFHVTGVYHGADIFYLFYGGQDVSTCPSNLVNLNVRDNIVKQWTSFIKTGVPDASDSWKPVSEGRYLVFDSSISLVNSSEIEDKYYNFWANLHADNNSATISQINVISIIVALVFHLQLQI